MNDVDHVWNMSVNLSYEDGSSGNTEVRKDAGGYSTTGVNVGRISQIRAFVTELGLTPKTQSDIAGLRSATFRFHFVSALDGSGVTNVAGDTEGITIESSNLTAVRARLNADPDFRSYFLA